MIRAFDEHRIRSVRWLDGQWAFAADPDNEGIWQEWYKRFPATEDKTYVPGCWNNDIGRYDYEGPAWYRTTFYLNEQQHIRLIFHAVLGYAEVYLDGERLGDHYGGFTPFEYVLADREAGLHELIVRCDNTHTRQTIPLDRVDWFHYGGIIRPVELQTLPDVYIERLTVTYRLQGRQAEVQCSVRLSSLAKEPREVPLCLMADDRPFHNETVALPGGSVAEININQRWDGVRLWQVGQAELYTITASTGEDDRSDRIGFRSIGTEGGRICINGQPVYLQGVNRHEEHPEWGFAFPPKLMKKDIDIIEHLGCNTIRGSHYPMSPYWLDLLDERGIVYWSEIPMWGFPKDVLADPVVIGRGYRMIEEMIDRDLHHPCIVFWSVHNEIDTNTREGYEITKTYVDLVRSKDTTRLVTCATHRPLTDLTLGLLDVIGLNVYYGWYNGKVEEFDAFLPKFHAYAASVGAGDKPVLMTEFGGAGIFGDVGWEEDRMFSEDYQAKIHAKALASFRADPKIAGTYIWQFADIRSDTPRFRDRARGFNNKGIVNEYRKPKQAYRVIRDMYRSAIAGEDTQQE